MRFFLNRLLKTVLILFICLGPLQAYSLSSSPQFIVHLLDYLAQDYAGAVDHGQLKSLTEYQEQMDFVQSAVTAYDQLPQSQKNQETQKGLSELQILIREKADASAVEQLARKLQARLIREAEVEIAPSRWPDLLKGRELFQQNCTSCHGMKGKGDGVQSAALNPPPANFHDPERMEKISPFQIYNTVRFGIPKTAMVPFSNLSDSEIWDLSFYVMSLRHADLTPSSKTTASDREKLFEKFGLKTLASSSDQNLRQQLSGTEEEKNQNLAILRQENPSQRNNSLEISKNYLQETLQDYEQGDKGSAKKKALLAYLEGIEPLEPKLRALDPSLVPLIEGQMGEIRSRIDHGATPDQLKRAIIDLDPTFAKVEALFQESAPSLAFVFFMAASIILREGFEAVLIIIAILGVLRVVGEKRASRWVHGGWLLALLSGGVLWIFSGWIMNFSGAGREMMEGVTSLVAVIVLLYVGFWLHSKTEIRRWTEFIDGKTRRALAGGSFLGLAAISFMAVFREAFETVLFLRALWLEGGASAKSMMAFGVASSFTLIFIFAFALLKFSVKLPIQKLFNFSAVLMSILAVILTGKGLHSLQETGLLPMTASPFKFHFDLLGFYPTLETLLPQLVVMILIVALWFYGKKSVGLKMT